MKPTFYCLCCDTQFQNPIWNGLSACCPNCNSTRWYDIQEEEEERYMKTRKKLPSDESPYP